MNHRHAKFAEGVHELAQGGNDRREQGHVISQGGTESARLHEVALHVNDDQRQTFLVKRVIVWLRLDF